LHWLTGGVWTLQAPGRVRAWVWLMLIPNDDPPPLSNEQRHCAWVWTTLESCEQHDDEGVDEFPVMYPRQGARLTIATVHPAVWADAWCVNIMAAAMATTMLIPVIF